MCSEVWHEAAPQEGDAVWQHLAAMAHRGFLLHGSQTADLRVLDPRTPVDFSVDSFSKRQAVFATEDPSWAIAYAIKSAHCPGFLNACFYPGEDDLRPSNRRIYLSYARGSTDLPALAEGVVYVLDPSGFIRMPSYPDPQLGLITECQWISPSQVPVVEQVHVTPKSLPLTP